MPNATADYVIHAQDRTRVCSQPSLSYWSATAEMLMRFMSGSAKRDLPDVGDMGSDLGWPRSTAPEVH